MFFGDGLSYIFRNVNPGLHTIYIKDINNCEASISTTVSLIRYPKFITSNEGSFNDYWKIEGLNDALYKSAEINIFDRYGKHLFYMNLRTNLRGWNGMRGKNKLQATVY